MYKNAKTDLQSSSEEEMLQNYNNDHQNQDVTVAEVSSSADDIDGVLVIKDIHNNNLDDDNDDGEISNEYVLNVAFWTFLGFLLLEAVFAIMAGSQAMLEDAEAMSVDAITYLFNLCAERIKNRPFTSKELEMPIALRDYRRERLRLYLELIPPLISVVTLVIVTIFALRDAFEDLFGNSDEGDQEEDDVDVMIMLIFSAANLILDLVNVLCFARAHQAVGISTTIRDYQESTRHSLREDVILAQGGNTLEMENFIDHHDIIVNGNNGEGYGSFNNKNDDAIEEDNNGIGRPVVNQVLVNLNMCSAWTHVCADTLRSVSVLIAAAIAFCFESVSGAMADSCAVIVVSLIILISLMPLLHGLYITAHKIIALQKPSNF